MPFVQRVVEPRLLGRATTSSLWDEHGRPTVKDGELETVTNGTLSNALRQLASLALIADDIFGELGVQLHQVNRRSEALKARIKCVADKVEKFDPKMISVPESDICTFAQRTDHFRARRDCATNLFVAETRPAALTALYDSATKTPVAVMRQLDRWRRDGHRSSRFFMCTPVLGAKRRQMRAANIDIETRIPAAVEDLRRWTSSEALGDITVNPECPNRIPCNISTADADETDAQRLASDDEGVDHKLPSPEEQLHVVALKFPSEIVPVDVSGRSFDRMSVQRRSLMHGDATNDGDAVKKRTKNRRPRSRRRNTLAGTDQKEIQNAICQAEDPQTAAPFAATETTTRSVGRSKSSDLLRPACLKTPPDAKKTTLNFNTLKQWGKTRYDKLVGSMQRGAADDATAANLYESVTMKRRRNVDKRVATHQRSASVSSSEKSMVVAATATVGVRLRDSQRRRRNKDEPHSSSGNWSASSESGRNSIGSEIASTTHPKSTTTTSSNSLNYHPTSSVPSRRRFFNYSASSSVTSEGTLTPDIIHDLHEDGETSSVYSCDTEGYYTSFHMDSGLKTLKEEELPVTPLHSSTMEATAAENEYELFGRGSTSTTTSSAGTICTTIRAESTKSLSMPAVPERKSSLSKLSTKSNSSLEYSDKTGTVKRSPAVAKATDKPSGGDVSPDSGHNTSSSPIESNGSPNGVRSGSEFEYSESSDMEGAERIERIRVKTTINSSRIPSMCVITPSQSDDDSSQSSVGSKRIEVNPQTGYATLESVARVMAEKNSMSATLRAPSPSGGTVIVRDEAPIKSRTQPIIKSTLLPLNNMFGKLRSNLANLSKQRRDSKSPNRSDPTADIGEYVTIADVRNNNAKLDDTDIVNKNLKTVLSGKIRDAEYISLNELPCNETYNDANKVAVDGDGKIVYNSDSLKRRRDQHTTFEPGPNVRPNAAASPAPTHRTPKAIRKVNANETTPTQQQPQNQERAQPKPQTMLPNYQGTYYEQPYVTDQYYTTRNQRYQTMPAKKTHMITFDPTQERSVTPDITRGLERHYGNLDPLLDQQLGIPFVNYSPSHETYHDQVDSFRVSPIDPRSSAGFKSSTPSQQIKSGINLEKMICSPTKSTMSNEELYAVIHKSKKKLNIKGTEASSNVPENKPIEKVKSPESGYLGKTRGSWSPSKDQDIQIDPRRQSWASPDKSQTSRLDFKKLLLKKSTNLLPNTKKLSAVEQLKISKEQIQKPPDPILELSRSPRNFSNRKFNSPRVVSEKLKSPPKIMSPRSQWRFANPRTDVLSSTIPEDCREDESPNSSGEKKIPVRLDFDERSTKLPSRDKFIPIAQRIQAQRAQFFQLGIEPSGLNPLKRDKKALETSF